MRQIIRSARHSLEVGTFILGRDILGQELCALLIERARAGVRVRLLVDSIGIWLGGRPNLKPLNAAGIETCMFVSPWRSPLPGRTNLRNHRKLIIADGERLWTGGRNLAAEYFVGDREAALRTAAWTDLSFRLEGELARQVRRQFEHDWSFATGRPLPEVGPQSATAPATESATESATDSATDSATAPRAQLIPSGPDQPEDTLYAMLVSGCYMAQSRILAITPYYVPDAALQMAFTLAALRGIRVDLVLPRHSNHRLADVARNAALRELIAAGGRVWLAPEMVHAKAIVIDGTLALAGSANLDERSLFLNYEMMIAFAAPDHVAAFAAWIESQRERAGPAELRPPGMSREFLEGLVRWLAFQI